MPFPLAHPAAVLPFRRWCPRFLSFPALVIGSIIPDASYLLTRFRLSEVAHQMIGTVEFSLPLGLAVLVLLHRGGRWTLPLMPAWLRTPLAPFCNRPLGSPLGLVMSVLIGAMTHVGWDSFAHTDGWFVQHLPLLQEQIGTVRGLRVRVCHLLWYTSTPLGVFCLVVAYQHWRQRTTSLPTARTRSQASRNALLCALSALPLSFVHHLLQGLWGQVLVVVLLALLLVGFLVWFEWQRQQTV